jgi:hypothetical protein
MEGAAHSLYTEHGHTATYVNSHPEAEEWHGYVLADVRLAVVPTLSAQVRRSPTRCSSVRRALLRSGSYFSQLRPPIARGLGLRDTSVPPQPPKNKCQTAAERCASGRQDPASDPTVPIYGRRCRVRPLSRCYNAPPPQRHACCVLRAQRLAPGRRL